MSAEGARRVIREELGADPEELFASFEAEPFASASIGQVHRARLADGREVAVKVQFEDVERAVRADLANASMFGAMLGPMGSKVGAKDHMRELEARFLEELDYRHEARQMAAFARPFEGHPRVRVPRVVEDRSARRVLTTELARGVDFEAACARPEAEREAWAETLWRFTFRSILGEGLFNADPHPGNYVFADDGVVWFLDFGCVRVMTPATHEHVRRAHGAALDGDSAELSAAFRDMFGVPHGGGTYARLIDDYVALAFEPIRTRGPYRMTRAYVQALVDGMRDNTSAAVRALFRWDDFRPMPAELLFFNRLQFGFYSVLARLDVDVDYGRIDRECLEQRRG
jgi:predicted unusual protein kinase regulating ubiquinone biosynthesis (AarF/ABC1/UbiB family)